MSVRSSLQSAVSRRTNEIVKDRDDALAGSRKETPAVNGKVRMVQQRLQLPSQGDSAAADAKPQGGQTEAAAASAVEQGSASATKDASPRRKNKSRGTSQDMTSEDRQRLAAMAYIQQQEAAAIAAVKSQRTKKKRTSQVDSSEPSPSPPPKAVPPPMSAPSAQPQNVQPAVEDAGAAAAAARRKITGKEVPAGATAKRSEDGPSVPPPRHQPAPPPQPPPAPPQQTAAEAAAVVAASAAAARKKILEKEQSSITNSRPQVGKGVTALRLKTSPADVQNGTASVPAGQDRASRSVALSKPLSPGPDRVGPDFASPSSLSLASAARLFRDLSGLPGTQPSLDGRLTYAEIVDGLGKRHDIAAQLGLPTKTAQEYHLRRLFKCAGPPSMARVDKVDSDAFSNYFASGGKVTENRSTPVAGSTSVPKLWKAGLTPRDDQHQPSAAQADTTAEGTAAPSAQKVTTKGVQESETTKPDPQVVQDGSHVNLADQAGEFCLL